MKPHIQLKKDYMIHPDGRLERMRSPGFQCQQAGIGVFGNGGTPRDAYRAWERGVAKFGKLAEWSDRPWRRDA